MKQKIALAVMASVLAGSLSFAIPASSETMVVGQLKQQTAPKKPGLTKSAQQPAVPAFQSGVKKTGPGILVQPAIQHKCMPGYSKLNGHINHNGGMDLMKCRSPIFECPDKSKVKSSNGTPAPSQGIEVKKVPVGPVGDSNRFRIEYHCTYFWPQG